MVKAKKIHGRDLMRPLMVQTVPPPLSYHGSDSRFDYFSLYLCKYKVPRGEEAMPDSYRHPFTSWREEGEKQKTGLSINKQGQLTIMLFPAAVPSYAPQKSAPAGAGGHSVFLKEGGPSQGKKQAALTDSLQAS